MTETLIEGRNQLSIEVANFWTNRLIGDKQPGETTAYVFATLDKLNADTPVQPSGLLDPVTLSREATARVDGNHW